MRFLLRLGSLLLISPALAQSPAQLSITSTTDPEVLQVLDSSGTWVTMGTVDPVNHIFTPVGGGSGPPPTGNCNQFNFSVACNSQYVGLDMP